MARPRKTDRQYLLNSEELAIAGQSFSVPQAATALEISQPTLTRRLLYTLADIPLAHLTAFQDIPENLMEKGRAALRTFLGCLSGRDALYVCDKDPVDLGALPVGTHTFVTPDHRVLCTVVRYRTDQQLPAGLWGGEPRKAQTETPGVVVGAGYGATRRVAEAAAPPRGLTQTDVRNRLLNRVVDE